MALSSEYIKNKAYDLGFHKVGITNAAHTKKEKNNLEDWISQKKHGDMKWMEKRKSERGDIFNYFPEAKTVISLGYNYYVGKTQSQLDSSYKVSNYAWGDDYHDIIKTKLFALLEQIKKKSPNIKGLVCVDTAPLMEKVWAQRAGLGWQGKHTNLISQDYGSWLFLGELVLNVDLATDAPFSEDLCGSCTACIDECPTQALDEYKIDASKCISYLTIEHRGEFHKGQDNLDGWIYGCDICQEVCPWNIKFSKISKDSYFEPREEIIDNTDQDWNNLSQDDFSKVFKKSAVKRTKFSGLKRNIDHNKIMISKRSEVKK
jgi:epoxyqueuosine reductase